MAPRKSAAAAASVASPRRSARLKQDQSSANSVPSDETLGTTIPHTPLDIPELLENILMNLPLRDILFSQRVCRVWQESILQSPNIQKALFLRVGSTTTTAWHSGEATKRRGHWCQHSESTLLDSTTWTEDCDGGSRPIGNPLVDLHVLGNSWAQREGVVPMGIDVQGPPWSSLRFGRVTMLGRMLLTYPPIRELYVWPANHRNGSFIADRRRNSVTVRNATGITVQDLADTSKTHGDTCDVCPSHAPSMTAASSGQEPWLISGSLLVRRPNDGITGWEMLEELRAALWKEVDTAG
ncbi:hypothetical protein LTR56_012442 [Elasticomyces elasticus]|nr:hypothetical protein LTR56_012442 [Elasticomyces elasticus]